MIVINGFKPFAGRERNGSETLARHLGGLVIGGYPVVFEILEVIWGAPEKALARWADEHEPVLLLGLGEGKGSRLHFERRAFNRASGCDEAGEEAPHAPLLVDRGSPELEATMRFDPGWTAGHLPSEDSEDAGSFLCNAWLYTAIQVSSCPTSFIHLPVQGSVPDDEYCVRWGPAIREILERNLMFS